MAKEADLKFGTEPLKVGDVTKEVDICCLAGEIYRRVKEVPDDLDPFADMDAQAAAVNAATAAFGFPAISSPIAAYKFSEDVLNWAIELKKAACGVSATEGAPASPSDFRD